MIGGIGLHEAELPMVSVAPGSSNPTTRNAARKTCAGLLPAIAAMILDPTTPLEPRIHATMLVRKLLSVEQRPPIQQVIDANIVPTIVEFLSQDDCPELQCEASLVLTDVVAGDDTPTSNTAALYAIEHGAVPAIVRNLNSPSDDVREQSMWVIGNLASAGPEFRDLILSAPAAAVRNNLGAQHRGAAKRGVGAVEHLPRQAVAA